MAGLIGGVAGAFAVVVIFDNGKKSLPSAEGHFRRTTTGGVWDGEIDGP
jgi:hypothetical protein